MQSQEVDGFNFRYKLRSRRRKTIAGFGGLGLNQEKISLRKESIRGDDKAAQEEKVCDAAAGDGSENVECLEKNEVSGVANGVVKAELKRRKARKSVAVKKIEREMSVNSAKGRMSLLKGRTLKGGRRKLYLDIEAGLCEEERLRLLMDRVLSMIYAWAVKNEKSRLDMSLVERATESVLAYVAEIVEDSKSMGGMKGMKRVDPRTLALRKEEALWKRTVEQLRLEKDKWLQAGHTGASETVEQIKSFEEIEDTTRECHMAQKEFETHRKQKKREEYELSLLRTEELIQKMRALERRQEDVDHFCEAISDALNERAFNGALSVQNTKSAVQQFLQS